MLTLCLLYSISHFAERYSIYYYVNSFYWLLFRGLVVSDMSRVFPYDLLANGVVNSG